MRPHLAFCLALNLGCGLAIGALLAGGHYIAALMVLAFYAVVFAIDWFRP